MAIKELIFGPNDETDNVKASLIFEGYEFKTDEKKIKEFEDKLDITHKHLDIPWEAK